MSDHHILATTVATGVKKVIHGSSLLSVTVSAANKITSFSHFNDAGTAATVDAAAAVGTTIYQYGGISGGKFNEVIWSNV